MGDTPVNLSPVAVGSGGRCGRWQAAVGDGARVPVGPIDTAGFDVDIHGINADTLVTLEGLLVSRMGVTGEQAADLIVIGDVEDLILRAWMGKRPGVGCGKRQRWEARLGDAGPAAGTGSLLSFPELIWYDLPLRKTLWASPAPGTSASS